MHPDLGSIWTAAGVVSGFQVTGYATPTVKNGSTILNSEAPCM